MRRNEKVHPVTAAKEALAAAAGGGVKDTDYVESKRPLPMQRSSTVQRLTSSSANSNILKRFQVVELEEGMLVEFIEDHTKPNQKQLCQIMLINDGEPPLYNLRVCNGLNDFHENRAETASVEVFRDGAVRKVDMALIEQYQPLRAGHKVQVFTKHPADPRGEEAAEEAWYNGEILSSSHSETSGVLYEVQLASGTDVAAGAAAVPKISDALQSVTYEMLRAKPTPDYDVGCLVELFLPLKGKNAFFPARVTAVSTESAVPGGIVYDLEYYPAGVIAGDPVVVKDVSPYEVRARFEPTPRSSSDGKKKGAGGSAAVDRKSYAEFRTEEGWLRCHIKTTEDDGTYTVNVEDGLPDTVPAQPSQLRVYLAVGECAMRKSSGRPVTIVKIFGDEDNQVFEVDEHLEGDMKRAKDLTRVDLERISQSELQSFGIENVADTSALATPAQRNAILDRIEDIVVEKGNGPFVVSCHAVDQATGTTVHHEHNVFTCAYTRDGAFFVTADISGRVMLREGRTGRTLDVNLHQVAKTEANPWIVNVVFNSDNTLLAVCLLSGVEIIQLRREPVRSAGMEGEHTLVRTGQQWKTGDVHQSGCLTCDFAPDRPDLLVSGGFDGTIMFWQLQRGSWAQLEQHDIGRNLVHEGGADVASPAVNSVRFSPQGNWLAVAAADGNCFLHCLNKTVEGGRLRLDLRYNDCVLLAHGHADEVTCVEYCNGDEGLLATGGKDNTVVVWSTVNGDMLARLTGGHVRDITSVTFDPSNKFVVSSSDDRRIIIWDAITAEKVGVLLGRHTSAVNRVVFRPGPPAASEADGDALSSTLVSVGNDERVLLWRPGGLRWQRIVKKDNNRHSAKRKDFKPILALAVHPTQEWLLFSESCDGRVMSTSEPIPFNSQLTQYLAKMDGSPVFCGSNPLTRKCADPAPPGWDPESKRPEDKKFKASSRLDFSDFNKGIYKKGWKCDGVPNKANGMATCEASFPGQMHPPDEMRFFCMECGYNICIACSGVDGHSMAVNSIDVSTDGTFACSVADDATCIVWDMRRLNRVTDPKAKDAFEVLPFYGQQVSASSFKFHTRAVSSVRISTSDLHFVTSSKTEFRSIVWEMDRLKPNKDPLYILEGGVAADFVDRQTVLTADKHFVRLYTLHIMVSSGQADTVVGQSPRGGDASGGGVAAAAAGRVMPVDFFTDSAERNGSCIEFRVGEMGAVTTMAVCSKIFKNYVALGDSFGSVAMLGLGSMHQREVYALPGARWRHHKDQVTCMAFNSSGHNLATGSSDMTVRIYSIRVHGTKQELNANGVRKVTVELCYMSTGGMKPFPKLPLHYRDDDGDGVDDNIADEDPHGEDAEFVGHMAPITSVAFSATGSELYSGDNAGHLMHWWWRADPHVDFSIAALSSRNTTACVTEWMTLLLTAFEFPRIGFDVDLELCNTVDVDTGVQMLTMIMAKNCFAGSDRDGLFARLFFADDEDADDDAPSSNKFLAGAIAGGTNSGNFMRTRNSTEANKSPLEIIFDPKQPNNIMTENLKYGSTMLNYWLAMGKSCMYEPADRGTPEMLANFLHISTAVAKILPSLAEHKIELAMDVLEKWSHTGLSLVTNPYAAFLTSEDSPHKFRKLFANAHGATGEVLDILPDCSVTPFGESLLSVQATGFHRDREYKYATDETTSRTEDFRFRVAPVVSAGFVPVVPCVFSLPYDRAGGPERSLLHILVEHEDLFNVVFDEKADTEFKSSPGISVLVNFKWRQYARQEYMARFFTYLAHYLCFCIFCYGLVIERQWYTGPPCNMFSESYVAGDWDNDLVNCSNESPQFEDLINSASDAGYTLGNIIFYCIMGGVTLFFSLYHLVMLIVQNRDASCKSFFQSSINANYLDLAVFVLMAATVVCFLLRTVHAGAVGAVTSVLAGWKFMLSWRGFSSTSHYIRTIIEITRFSYVFLFMLIFFSVGCGWAFMLLFGGWQEEHLQPLGIEFEGADGANQYELFGTAWRTIVTSWDFMVGNTDIEAWLDSYYELIAIPLFFFFSFMVVLVMLNLVIALMADGYTTVMETQSKAKIIERANIIVGIEKTMHRGKFDDPSLFPVWVHALMVENKGATPIGDMPPGFEDSVSEKLDSLVEALANLKEERDADHQALSQTVETLQARLQELQRGGGSVGGADDTER